MSDDGIGARDNVFDSATLHYDQALEIGDITQEVKVSNPAPIFVGTYSHVFRGVYNGETVSIGCHLRKQSSDICKGCSQSPKGIARFDEVNDTSEISLIEFNGYLQKHTESHPGTQDME
jgi:hypothetical protein